MSAGIFDAQGRQRTLQFETLTPPCAIRTHVIPRLERHIPVIPVNDLDELTMSGVVASSRKML
jgi:hypothetical protein